MDLNVTTEFNVGDTAYYYNKNLERILSVIIKEIKISCCKTSEEETCRTQYVIHNIYSGIDVYITEEKLSPNSADIQNIIDQEQSIIDQIDQYENLIDGLEVALENVRNTLQN